MRPIIQAGKEQSVHYFSSTQAVEAQDQLPKLPVAFLPNDLS